MVRYWIIPITYDNWLVCHKEMIYGFGESLENHIKKGDIIIFYVMKSRCSNPDYASYFANAYEVVSNWFKENKPLWPDEVKAKKVLYPHRVTLRLVKEGKVKVEELVDELGFIKRKDVWKIYFRGCPANFKKPIPEEDAKLIIERLR